MRLEPPYAIATVPLKQKLRGLMRHWLEARKAEGEFQRNLADWRRGGPAEQGGWTRSGPPIQTPACTLGSVRRELVSAEECFAKNTAEVKRWHIAFLETLRSRGDLYATAYWSEYLLPRFPREAAQQRVTEFAALFRSIALFGWRAGSYAWLADLASMPGLQPHFGFRYFRFDGAHRLSCLYVLGVRQIPCLVFSLRDPNGLAPGREQQTEVWPISGRPARRLSRSSPLTP